MSIIIKRFILNQNENTLQSINEYETRALSSTTFYDQVNNLDRTTIVLYSLFAITTYYFFSRVTLNINTVIATFVVTATIYYMINNTNNTNTNEAIKYNDKLKYLENILFNGTIYNKRKNIDDNILNILPNNMPPENKSYLHLSKPTVELYYSMRELSQYNPSSFRSSLNSMNNLLKLNISMEIDKSQLKYIFDNAKMQADNCMNALQSIILSIPSNNVYNNFFTKSLTSLQKLINLYMHSMSTVAKTHYNSQYKSGNLNIDSHEIINDAPNANDTKSLTYSHNYNFY